MLGSWLRPKITRRFRHWNLQSPIPPAAARWKSGHILHQSWSQWISIHSIKRPKRPTSRDMAPSQELAGWWVLSNRFKNIRGAVRRNFQWLILLFHHTITITTIGLSMENPISNPVINHYKSLFTRILRDFSDVASLQKIFTATSGRNDYSRGWLRDRCAVYQ